MMPTEDQLIQLIEIRTEHEKHCQLKTTYNLSQRGRIRLECPCGWLYDIFETESYY